MNDHRAEARRGLNDHRVGDRGGFSGTTLETGVEIDKDARRSGATPTRFLRVEFHFVAESFRNGLFCIRAGVRGPFLSVRKFEFAKK